MNNTTCKLLVILSVIGIIVVFITMGYFIHRTVGSNDVINNVVNSASVEGFETNTTDFTIFNEENAPDNAYQTYLILLHKTDCDKGKELYVEVWKPLKQFLEKYSYLVNDVKVTLIVLDSEDPQRGPIFDKISYSEQISVEMFPSIVLFHRGKLCQYNGDLDIESILRFLKASVQEDEFICSSPHYYNDEKETNCLPFLMEE